MELIRRQAEPVRIPSADELDTEQFMTDLLGPASGERGRQRGRMARAAKLIGLAVGSIVLCGSVAAAATLARSRPPTPAPVVAAPTPITGLGALRPDTLEAQLSGHAPSAPVASAPKTAVTPPTGAKDDQGAGGAAANTVTVPQGSDQQPSVPVPSSAAALVREFYQLVATQPAAAAQLLAPSLLSADPTGFISAWSSASRVEVESVQTNPDGTVQAVVRMVRADGSWLRVVELLHVTSGDDPVITGAQLLSAQNG